VIFTSPARSEDKNDYQVSWRAWREDLERLMESLPQKMAGVVLKMEHDGSSNVFLPGVLKRVPGFWQHMVA
jgi:hypothetical protein